MKQRDHVRSKGSKPLLRGVGCLAGIHRSGDAHQGTVAAVHLDGVDDQVELRPVLTGDPAIVGPVPIKNEFPGVSFRDDITVRRKRFVARHGEGNALVLHRSPAGSGKTVLGRMDGITDLFA